MTYIKLTKKRIAVAVRFMLRPHAKDANGNRKPFSNPHPIQCRITVDGVPDAGFSTGIRVDPALWNQKGQKVTGRSDQAQRVNRLLTQLKTKIEQIHDWQIERHQNGQGPKPTPKTIRHEYDTGNRPERLDTKTNTPKRGITLISACDSFLKKLNDEQATAIARHPATVGAYERAFEYLKQFIGENSKMLAEDVTAGWAKQYYAWLLQQPKQRKSKTGRPRSLSVTANTVMRVSTVLDYLKEFNVLPGGNPLKDIKLQQSPDKEVYFMEPEHIDRLFALKLKHTAGVILWWAKLMVITGMDYPDAVIYAQNRDKYTLKTPYGDKIVIKRLKSGVKSEIPVTGAVLIRLNALFDEYPTGARVYDHTYVNRLLNGIAAKIGFAEVLTVKILRKTAGAWMLWRGFRLEAVSKALGHTSITTTQRYYVKITGTLIDLEMKRMYESGGGAYMAA